MNFKQFLVEKVKNDRLFSQVAYQKLLDNLDLGHINYSKNRLEFSIGRIIKDSRLDNLFMVIRKESEDSVKYASYKNKEDEKVIVIDTQKYPKRINVDKFLSNDPKLHKAVLKYISKFVGETEFDDEPKNDIEFKKTYNTKEKFEEAYEKLMDVINKINAEYTSASNELDNESAKSINYAKRLAFNQAREHLKDDYFGNSSKEFISILSKTEEGKFINHLEKEFKNMLMSRLDDFYESKIQEL